MLYLIDANAIIQAEQDYYGFEQVPQFWEWLLERAKSGDIKMPIEIYNEIANSQPRSLQKWITSQEVKFNLPLQEEVDAVILNHILSLGYAPDLTDVEIEKIGRDPFLIAYAMMGKDRVVVTKEVSAPSKQRGNRKLPDVCKVFGVTCITDFAAYRALNFKAR